MVSPDEASSSGLTQPSGAPVTFSGPLAFFSLSGALYQWGPVTRRSSLPIVTTLASSYVTLTVTVTETVT